MVFSPQLSFDLVEDPSAKEGSCPQAIGDEADKLIFAMEDDNTSNRLGVREVQLRKDLGKLLSDMEPIVGGGSRSTMHPDKAPGANMLISPIGDSKSILLPDRVFRVSCNIPPIRGCSPVKLEDRGSGGCGKKVHNGSYGVSLVVKKSGADPAVPEFNLVGGRYKFIAVATDNNGVAGAAPTIPDNKLVCERNQLAADNYIMGHLHEFNSLGNDFDEPHVAAKDKIRSLDLVHDADTVMREITGKHTSCFSLSGHIIAGAGQQRQMMDAELEFLQIKSVLEGDPPC